VHIVRPNAPGEHWRALSEVANGIEWSFLQLGAAHHRDRLVVFNIHRFDGTLPPHVTEVQLDGAIIYNAEQVPTAPLTQLSPGWQKYLDVMRKRVVWDYSTTNIERLRRYGVEKLVHCRVGWWPGLRVRLPPCHGAQHFADQMGGYVGRCSVCGGSEVLPVEQDVDVLFIGSVNARRAMLFIDLAARGLKLKTLFGVYGQERDDWMLRSKVILNAHFYDNPIHEIFRTSHALANSKCVVTEDGGCDSELENFAAKTMVRVPYAKLGDVCADMVKNSDKRRYYEIKGHAEFGALQQVDEVRRALEETEKLW
jgi:hypothetical protein